MFPRTEMKSRDVRLGKKEVEGYGDEGGTGKEGTDLDDSLVRADLCGEILEEHLDFGSGETAGDVLEAGELVGEVEREFGAMFGRVVEVLRGGIANSGMDSAKVAIVKDSLESMSERLTSCQSS